MHVVLGHDLGARGRLVLSRARILAEARRAQQRAAVRRDKDGAVWVTHWTSSRPGRVAGTQLRGSQAAKIRGPDWTVVGGVLPVDATAARVRDERDCWVQATAAQGAWIAFISVAPRLGLPPIRFHDQAGEAIFTPPQLKYRDTERPEARGPAPFCEACGADNWRSASAAEGHGKIIFCGSCGFYDGAVRSRITICE